MQAEKEVLKVLQNFGTKPVYLNIKEGKDEKCRKGDLNKESWEKPQKIWNMKLVN